MKFTWRQGILYATVIAMEGSWLNVVLELINEKAVGGLLSTAGILLLLPISFLFNSWLYWLRWHRFFRGLANIFAWVIALLLMVKLQLFSGSPWADSSWLLAVPKAIANLLYAFAPELIILLGSGVGWWLGWRLAHTRITFSAAIGEFQFGLVILLIAFATARGFEIQIANATTIALFYFLVALSGISIAHAEEGKSWLASLQSGHWLGLLLISLSIIALLGMVIGSLLTPEFIKLIVNALNIAWQAVLSLIMKVIMFFANLFPMEPGQIGPPEEVPPPQDELGGFKPHELMPEWLRRSLRLGWTIMVLGILIIALWRMFQPLFRWLFRRFSGQTDAEFESMQGAFKADILSFFKRIIYRLLRLKLPFRQKAASAEMSPIRQMYRDLLQWAAAQGYPRLAFQTPYEYLNSLEAVLPESGKPLHEITRHYVRARYGLTSPTDAELHELKRDWHEVKKRKMKPPGTSRDKETPHG